MKLNIEILKNGVIYSMGFLNGCKFKRLSINNEFIIDLYKVHNHSYYYKAFFYNSKNIYCSINYGTKAKLYSAVQNILKEELYNVIQFYD